ncbi:glycosyltransferase [Paenibacillus sp. OT2-17]|jgi:dolichol-phosphate mannosyltransferase|uniref:glycosyltransferase n=1 Tax=unclassified Paenibacillus TaxID=185978 RepID=UPI0013546E6C|nr:MULTISPECIES: glycosyltransferase [unclassified Paenibacillus]MBP1173296.1 dolichol-phosphate mannosyltransferase [Paenibacillus sp. PvR133]MXO77301.1 glycosyltransferase [Paenibacillus sp. OT2-17]
MKEQVFVSTVLYAHNNEHEIVQALTELDRTMMTYFQHYEIILVNDFSQDKTLENAHSAMENIYGDTTIINLSRKHGVEHAMMAGLNKSMGDFVFEIESLFIDFNLDLLYEMFKTATGKGFDIVAATSGQAGWKSRMFYRILNRVSYLNLSLSTETARLVTRRALNAMLNLKEKVRYRKALYELTGYSKNLINYKAVNRLTGRKVNRENISLAVDALVSFSHFGLRAAHLLTGVFFLFSLFMGGYALYNYFFNQSVVQGWTTLMILISLGFAGLFFIGGIIGEYTSRILIEIQNRPFYSTKSVEMYKEKKPRLELIKEKESASGQ